MPVWKSGYWHRRGGDPLDYYTVIPATVRHDHDLSPLARLVYGDISALARITGVCTATNATIAAENGRGSTATRDAIKELADRGHIRIDFAGAGNTGRVITPLSENRQDLAGKPAQIRKKIYNTSSCSRSKERKRATKEFDSDSYPYKAAVYLDKRIRENYRKIKPQNEAGLQKWASEFDKCHRIDGWEWQDISEILAYSQDSDFWRKNIRSGSKFRKQCDALYAEAVEKGAIEA